MIRRTICFDLGELLIRYCKLAIIHVPVGEGEGDDVVARERDVELDAVGGEGSRTVHGHARGSGYLHGHLAEVLGECHG